MSRISFAVAVLLVLLGRAVAGPSFDTLSDTLRAVRTVSVTEYIYEYDSTYYLSASFGYGQWYNPFPPPMVIGTMHATFKFDLSPIPDTALVTAAEFGFFQHSDDTDGTPECRPRVYDYAGTEPESLFHAIESAAAVANEFEAHFGWNRIRLTQAGVEAIRARLTTDSLRLAAASGAWGELGYAYGSSDPETLRPYLFLSYLPTAVEERLTLDAPRPTLEITPNPCRSFALLHWTAGPPDHSTTLAIYDASGRLALSQPIHSSSFILQTSSLTAGVYVARCPYVGRVATARFTVVDK